MSRVAVRAVAAVLGAVAFVGHLLVTFQVEPWTWTFRLSGALATYLAADAASFAVPMLLYVWILRPQRRRPALLLVDAAARRFVAPAWEYLKGLAAVALMWLGAGLPMTERVPNGDRVRLAHIPGATVFSVTTVTLAVGVSVVLVLVNRPYVILEPSGLTIRHLRRRSSTSWDDLMPGRPLPPRGNGSRNVPLYRNPPAPGSFVRADTLPTGWLRVDPGFLTNVIRHYVDHPQHRNEIGTEAELQWLRSAAGQPSIADTLR